MPRKTFVTGTVLTASDVNTFLMNQSVMVFASASARNTAITSPTEGMIAYLSDTNALTLYDGSAWVGAVNTGSLNGYTGVTFADVSVAMSTAGNWIRFTIPAGKLFSDIVSVVPFGGVNDIVYINSVVLGNWSGVQGTTQVMLYTYLGNAVASSNGTIRFYFRSL
jgi:hypothetical protein